MDAPVPDSWLYDPLRSAEAVRAHRPSGSGAATCVVSDALWGDVLSLVRWAQATSACPADLRAGAAWRTATRGDRAPVRELAAEVGTLGAAAIAVLVEDPHWWGPR